MADLSLEDIIKRRNIRPLLQTPTRQNMNDGQGQGWNSAKGNMNQTSYSNNTEHKEMGDVRNKIIQQKRHRMHDARDRLAELAKQGDARDRLNKIRRNAAKSSPTKKTGPWKNNNPHHTNSKNENRPSNLEGKTLMKGSSLTRTVAGGGATDSKAGGIRNKPAAPLTTSTNGRASDSGRYHPLPSNPHVVTIKNEKARLNNSSYYSESVSARASADRGQEMRYTSRPVMRPSGRPFNQPVAWPPMPPYDGGRSGMMRVRSPNSQQGYRPRSPLQQEIRPTRLKITTANNYKEPSPLYSDEWDVPVRPPVRVPVSRMPPSHINDSPPRSQAAHPRSLAKKRPVYEEEEIPPVRPKKVVPLSSGLLARLDQPARPPPGFKVLVTNLHPCVTVADMEELFGTIGRIISARLLKQGVAEAVFYNKEDAMRSVEVFNNRQLDGQPMCVTLVNRPNTANPTLLSSSHPPSQTSSVLKAASGSSVVGVVGGLGGTKRTSRPRQEEMIAPDISAIHQALFNRHQPPASIHTFVVKVPKPQPRENSIEQ
ncbi:hypothetical protein Pmani_033610 [Petrolisthes manimaculis]|uniref:RRM domain-containing protein n=1 Tax=Petrolisthes manimaculis TaxID=1843537 RepID=A0AAE1NQK3_9EUCA|nr:hypothetical protein Pmani_033610 [Petrolisthes manimaculis]